jgi:hypothetical protein
MWECRFVVITTKPLWLFSNYPVAYISFKALTISTVHLIRPQESALKDIDKDYSLSCFSNNPVKVTFVEGNHLTMLESKELEKILQDFSQS